MGSVELNMSLLQSQNAPEKAYTLTLKKLCHSLGIFYTYIRFVLVIAQIILHVSDSTHSEN